MALPLDTMGNISLILQIIIVFLLLLGLPLEKRVASKKEIRTHGYLIVFALVFHTLLIFVSMIPSLVGGFGRLEMLPSFEVALVWSHIILGVVVEILGFLIVGVWFTKPFDELACCRFKKLMLPLFILWEVSLYSGIITYISGAL
jgi:hypothetical protein